MNRVVVTGLGLLTSIGSNYKNTWNNLLSGKSGIKKINQFDIDDLPCKIAGYLNNDTNDPSFFDKSHKILNAFCLFFVNPTYLSPMKHK